MRWFKHLSGAHRGRFLGELLEEFGAQGYGAWWIILEEIAAQMDSTDRCSASKTVFGWSQTCRIKPKTFHRFIEFVQTMGKCRVKLTGENARMMTISVPNLLKYRDEHSRKLRSKSGVTPDRNQEQLRSRVEQNRTEQKRTEENSGVAPLGLAAPELTDEERRAGLKALKTAVQALDGKTEPETAKGERSPYLDQADPEDQKLTAQAAALGIPVHTSTPRAVLQTLISSNQKRKTPKGEKY